MNEAVRPSCALGPWVLEKRTADGRLYEVVMGDGDKPSRVSFRAKGIAASEEYAWDVPFQPDVVEVRAGDAARPHVTEKRE